MKVGIVASVGGLKPVAIVGHAVASHNAGVWKDVAGFAAASGGAPWCALLATGMIPSDVWEIALSIRKSDYTDSETVGLFRYARAIWLSILRRQFGATLAEIGIYSGKAMEKHLGRVLPVKTFEELAIPLAIPVTALNWRSIETITSGELIPAIRATTAIPFVYRPPVLTIRGEETRCVDGGVARPIPVGDLVDLVPDVDIILAVVACNVGNDTEYTRTRKIDLGEYLDATLDTLVYDHIQAVIELAVQQAPLVLLPIQVGASMDNPEKTVLPALEAAKLQGERFYTSELWEQLSSDPGRYKGQTFVFN
jgi:predicted acylesterase/phospholipase RssA